MLQHIPFKKFAGTKQVCGRGRTHAELVRRCVWCILGFRLVHGTGDKVPKTFGWMILLMVQKSGVHSPVDMVNIPLFTWFYTSQVVVWDFWTINSTTWTCVGFPAPCHLISRLKKKSYHSYHQCMTTFYNIPYTYITYISLIQMQHMDMYR